MTYKKALFTFVTYCLLLSSCNNRNNDTNNSINQDNAYRVIDSEVLFDAHKESMRKENIQINDFLERYKWDMQTTPTGLRYMIYERGEGRKAEKGDIVELNYTVKFLNGELVYSSDNDGVKTFQLSKSQETSGLEEGILKMNCGDKARLIVPSYLAYGVTGDLKKISIKNTLIYDIHLVDLK